MITAPMPESPTGPAPPETDPGGPIVLAGEGEPALPQAGSPWLDAGLAVAIVLGLGLALCLHLRRRRMDAMPEARRVFLTAARAAGLRRRERRALETLAVRSGVPAAALLLSDEALRTAARAAKIGSEPATGGSGGRAETSRERADGKPARDGGVRAIA